MRRSKYGPDAPPEEVHPKGTRWRLKLGGRKGDTMTDSRHTAIATTQRAAVRILRDRGVGSPTVELWP